MRRWAILLVLVAACGGSEAPEAAPAPAERIQREAHLVAGHDRPEMPCLEAGPGDPAPRLELGDTFFAPTCVVLRGRHDLLLDNGGRLAHSFGVRAAGLEVDLGPGEDGEVSLEALRGSGSTEFYCRFHASAGMTGRITVT